MRSPEHRSAARAAWLVALGAAAGCISVPSEDAPECRRTADCDQAVGEVCEEGICWGDPPRIPMAAIIGPPGDAKDLVPAEMPSLMIPEHGWMSDVVLGTPVIIHGRVLRECALPLCPVDPVEATISVTRPSSFPGGPGLSMVESTDSDGNFTLALPLTRLGQEGRPDDLPYTVTISPADRGATRTRLSSTAAEELPPRRMSLIATQDTTIELRLPSEGLPTVQGRLVDGAGAALAGYRVVARGRWSPGEPLGEVSTVAVTAVDGSYALALSEGLIETVAVRAEPPASRPGAAELEIGGVGATTDSTGIDFSLPTNERPPVLLSIPVEAADSGGEVMPVDGVAVRLRYEINDGMSAQISRYNVEGTTKNGRISLLVVPGVTGTNWTYSLHMLPPADSRLASVFDRPAVIGLGGELPTVRLEERVRVAGRLLDSRGRPLNSVTLTARPSRSFLQEIDSAKRAFVDEIAATTATTSKTGEFVVWADQSIAGVAARYSLTMQPPEGAFMPTWTHSVDVTIPPGEEVRSVNIGELSAPEAANVHGRIINPGGRPVAKGRVLIYRLDESCVTVAGCSSTAQLIGSDVADEDGIVRISLPKTY
ncbi:MAG: hypothetical protein R3B48_05990 [Kofleriaceae bacterium]